MSISNLSSYRLQTIFRQGPVLSIIAAIVAVIVGSLVGVLSMQYLAAMLVMLLGLPLLALTVNPSSQQVAIVLLLSFVPLIGIVKAFSGSRFAPLTFDIGIALVCTMHLTKRLITKQKILDSSDLMIYLLILLALLQMFNPNVPNLQASIEGFRKFAFMTVGFYAGKHVISVNHIQWFQRILIATSILIALYAIKQYYYLSDLEYRIIELSTASRVTYLMDGYLRPFSTLPGPFHLGLYLIVTILLLSRYMISGNTNTNWQLFFFLAIGIELIALIMTRTKGNWGGLLIGVILLNILNKKQFIKKILTIIVLISLAVGISLFFLSFLPDNAQTSITRAISAVSNPSDAPTLLFRMQLWKDTVLPAIISNPIWGYGTSSAGEGLSNLYEGTSSSFFSSHNLYFKIFLELGMLGFLTFAYIIYSTIHRSVKLLFTSYTLSEEKALTLQWCTAVIGAFLVAGAVIPVLDAYPVNLYFWLLVGFVHRKNWRNTDEFSIHSLP